MAEAEEGLVIDIDAPDDRQVDKEGKVIPASEGIADLKAQMAETNARADQAAERARTAEAEAAALRSQNAVAIKANVENAEIAVKGEIDGLKKEHTAALEAGEYEKASDISLKMGDAAARARELQNTKAQIETQPGGDRVESYINQFSQRSQAWLRDHRDCVTDDKKNKLMIAAHNRALASDIKPDSDAYFDFLERDIGLTTTGGGEQQKPTPRREAPSLAAPVTRNPPRSNGQQPNRNQVQLTKEEVDTAEMMGMTPREYAIQKQKLEAAGQLGQKQQA